MEIREPEHPASTMIGRLEIGSPFLWADGLDRPDNLKIKLDEGNYAFLRTGATAPYDTSSVVIPVDAHVVVEKGTTSFEKGRR